MKSWIDAQSHASLYYFDLAAINLFQCHWCNTVVFINKVVNAEKVPVKNTDFQGVSHFIDVFRLVS